MHTCYLLFDKKKVIHDGFKNRYYFVKDGKFFIFIPFSLKNVDECHNPIFDPFILIIIIIILFTKNDNIYIYIYIYINDEKQVKMK
jgi:hypothetical protein